MGFTLELGKERMIPGFEKPLVGAKKGEEVIVDVTFPEDYHAEALKGKEAQFTVNVKKVEGLTLPKVDEEFAKLFGIEDGDVEALKEEVIAKLLEKNELDLPAALVDQEVNALREQAKQRFSQQGGGQNLPDLPADLFKDNAQRRVSIGLLLGEIIKQNDLKADQEKVDS